MINKLRDKNAQKRGGGQTALVLDELLGCVPSGKTIDDELDQKELAAKIGEFVRGLSVNDRRLFICRYWYLDSIADISQNFGYSQSKTKTTLHRLRGRLLTYLKRKVFLMTSDKLLDAIGMLDDDLILDARNGRRAVAVPWKQILAAAALIAVVTVAFAGVKVLRVPTIDIPSKTNIPEPTQGNISETEENIKSSELYNTENYTEGNSDKIRTDNIFISTSKDKLKFGYVSCYTNPQGIENEDNEENLYGVAGANGTIILEPNYKEAYPVNESVFAVKIEKNGKAVAVLRYAEGGYVLVNEAGNKTISKTFENVYATDFNQNILQAFDSNNAYFVSNEGKIIVTLPKNQIVADPFSVQSDSASVVISACYAPEKYGQSIVFGIYDRSEKKEIVPCSRSYGYAISPTRFVLEDIDYMGLDLDGFAAIYDEKGNTVCASGSYQEIIFTYGASRGIGVRLVVDNGETALKYWIIDANGSKLSAELAEKPTLSGD